MNANEIISAVLESKKSLVFVTRGFSDPTKLGIFVKDDEGNLTKVHGKSANVARKMLISKEGIVRSYGKGYLTVGKKTKSAYLSEFKFMPELL